jgi:hypothetical protein
LAWVDNLTNLRETCTFFGSSDDYRHRLLFFLILLFCMGIGYELFFDDKTAKLDVIKSFTDTIIWLVGIYVGGTVAAAFAPGGAPR